MNHIYLIDYMDSRGMHYEADIATDLLIKTAQGNVVTPNLPAAVSTNPGKSIPPNVLNSIYKYVRNLISNKQYIQQFYPKFKSMLAKQIPKKQGKVSWIGKAYMVFKGGMVLFIARQISIDIATLYKNMGRKDITAADIVKPIADILSFFSWPIFLTLIAVEMPWVQDLAKELGYISTGTNSYEVETGQSSKESANSQAARDKYGSFIDVYQKCIGAYNDYEQEKSLVLSAIENSALPDDFKTIFMSILQSDGNNNKDKDIPSKEFISAFDRAYYTVSRRFPYIRRQVTEMFNNAWRSNNYDANKAYSIAGKYVMNNPNYTQSEKKEAYYVLYDLLNRRSALAEQLKTQKYQDIFSNKPETGAFIERQNEFKTYYTKYSNELANRLKQAGFANPYHPPTDEKEKSRYNTIRSQIVSDIIKKISNSGVHTPEFISWMQRNFK